MRKRDPCAECGRAIVARISRSMSRVQRPQCDHDLCQRCWKALKDRERARWLDGQEPHRGSEGNQDGAVPDA